MEENVLRLISLFNSLFAQTYNTQLIAGTDEPVYLPANDQVAYHQLVFAHGHFASVLHEVAHWCVAGPERRLLEDFGYWYRPDGRTAQQQAEFEQVEVKPQALEWMFSIACGHKFTPSMDNLNAPETAPANTASSFKEAVAKQCLIWCDSASLPSRAKQFIEVLVPSFDGADPLNARLYQSTL